MRILKGRPLNLSHTFLDDETPLALSAVTVTLRDSQGVTVTTAGATDGGEGLWTVSLPMQPLGVYTAEWDGGTAVDETTVEVVGGFLFSIPEVRESDDYLADATKFPAAEIAHYREVVEREFERISSRSFTTRVKDFTFTSDGTREQFALIPDAQAIESAWINDVAVADVTAWEVSSLGKITSPELAVKCDDRVRVRVRYGFTTPPVDISRVGMVRLRSLLAAESSGIPDRATTWQPQEGGTFRLATPGMGKSKTGIPEVDSALADYSLDIVLSAVGLV